MGFNLRKKYFNIVSKKVNTFSLSSVNERESKTAHF